MKCIQMSTVFTVNCNLSPKAFVDVLLIRVGFSNFCFTPYIYIVFSISLADITKAVLNLRIHCLCILNAYVFIIQICRSIYLILLQDCFSFIFTEDPAKIIYSLMKQGHLCQTFLFGEHASFIHTGLIKKNGTRQNCSLFQNNAHFSKWCS